MPNLWKQKQLRKKRVRYNFICDVDGKTEQNMGESSDPCQTTYNHWIIYNEYPNKSISFDIDHSSRQYNFYHNLELIEKNGVKTYKYNKEIINRERFILLLGCETEREAKGNTKY